VEKEKRQITLPETEIRSFKLLLQFLYTGAVSIPSDNTAIDLLKLSSRFLIENLKSKVETWFLQRLDLENAFQYFFLGLEWNSNCVSQSKEVDVINFFFFCLSFV
jgi:hypothetical protein